MATKTSSAHARIVVGLPNLQDQVRLVDRLTTNASDAELERLQDLAHLLAELYDQLQQKKQVTVYRFTSKSRARTAADRA